MPVVLKVIFVYLAFTFVTSLLGNVIAAQLLDGTVYFGMFIAGVIPAIIINLLLSTVIFNGVFLLGIWKQAKWLPIYAAVITAIIVLNLILSTGLIMELTQQQFETLINYSATDINTAAVSNTTSIVTGSVIQLIILWLIWREKDWFNK